MKRLKNILLNLEPNDSTYEEMYNGRICVYDQTYPEPSVEYDPNYFREDIGFLITATNKLCKDKPTVTISIPAKRIISSEGGDKMKRLKYILTQMENNTTTFKEIYEGKMEVNFPSNAWDGHTLDPEIQYDATYHHKQISMNIEETNKSSKDKPTVKINIPTEVMGINDLTTAAADYCLREFKRYIDDLNDSLYNRSRPDNENGKYYLHTPGGEVLKRNSAFFQVCPQRDYEYMSGSSVMLINDGINRRPEMCLCIRLQVQLPKRKIRKTIQMLCRDLPDAVEKFIYEFDTVKLEKILELSEKQALIRQWLKTSDYCAFIANGSILPRTKGTDLPMLEAIPFCSPPDDEINIFGIKGMGIRKGVTVITGGGYSGKSTLLDAISVGIYDHYLGDGRELCITDNSAMTISAEDGRSVKNVNISPFIKWLPNGNTADFSTDHASGSTSQAANIMEAVNVGSKLLLIDEDKSATNFMIRDQMMKQLIKNEPITPFTDRVNELYNANGVSTILVIGGSGEYLSVADRIYMMDEYKIHDATKVSKDICSNYKSISLPDEANWVQTRTLHSDNFTSYPEGCGTEKLLISDMGFIVIGDEKIDVRDLHNIVSKRQLDALGFIVRYLEITNKDQMIDLNKRIDELYARIELEGVDILYSAFFTTCERFLDLPRKQEVFAVINRMRRINYSK